MQQRPGRTLRAVILLAGLLAVAALATDLAAYERYKNDAGAPFTNCALCHGDFDDSSSPAGTVFPSSDKHAMHRSAQNMNSDCDLCHTASDDRNPWLGSSDGTANNPGLGCTGCHGRELDVGNDDISNGRGAGLRQHHFNAGQEICADCHSDADPANYTPVPENVTPLYYGTLDTNVDLPCNGTAAAETNENWSIGDFIGSDNDGDGIYDAAETDCFNPPQTPGDALLRVSGKDTGVGELTIAYDSACLAQGNSLIFGPLAQVSSYAYSGAICSISNSGTYTWAYDAASVFFLVVGNDAAGTEGSYGLDRDLTGAMNERPNDATCALSQDLANICP